MQNKNVIDLTLTWWQEYESAIRPRNTLPALCDPQINRVMPPAELFLRRR